MKTYAEEKRIRPDILTSAVYLAVAMIMIYEIVCQRIYGEKGAYFSAAPFSIYLFCYCTLILAVQKAVYVMVRLRARRSQYMNAETNMHRSMRVFGISGLLIGALFVVLSYTISKRLLGYDRGFFQIIIAGVAIMFLGLQGVLRGYLQGIGYTKPIVIADMLVSFVSFVIGTIATIILYAYGLKVNNLFHVDEYSAVYGSTGMMIGLLAGTIAGFIQSLVSYNLRKAEIAEFVKSGAPRYLDNKNDVLTGIRPLLLLYGTAPLLIFADQCYYVIITRKFIEDADYISGYGLYFGRIIIPAVLFTMICCIPFIKSWNRVMARIERDEYEGARERLKGLVRFSNMFLIPVTLFIFVLPETVQTALFSKSSDLANQLTLPGALMIFFAAYAVLLSWLLNHMGKSVVILINIGASWALHIVCLILFIPLFKMGVLGLLLATLLALVMYDVMSFLMISKMLKYRQDWMRGFLLPLIASAVAALVVFLLNLLLFNLIGELLTLIICIIIYWIVFMVVMIALRGIGAPELKRVPFGRFFFGIARALQGGGFED